MFKNNGRNTMTASIPQDNGRKLNVRETLFKKSFRYTSSEQMNLLKNVSKIINHIRPQILEDMPKTNKSIFN